MKKYLFLILSILSIFFVSDRVEALSFTATNGKNYTVDSEESFLDYCYFTYYKNSNYDVVFGTYQKEYFCNYKSKDNRRKANKNIYGMDFRIDFFLNGNKEDFLGIRTSNFTNFYDGYSNTRFSSLLYTNFNVYTDSNFTNIYFNTDFPVTEIEERYLEIIKYKITYYLNDEIYKEIEVEKGSSHSLIDYDYNSDLFNFSGWSVDENKDLLNITSDISIHATLKEKDVNTVYVKNFDDFPITKTDFYALLVLLATLIIFLFLRWCFPLKGGKNL